jgi:hypothetical protein
VPNNRPLPQKAAQDGTRSLAFLQNYVPLTMPGHHLTNPKRVFHHNSRFVHIGVGLTHSSNFFLPAFAALM